MRRRKLGSVDAGVMKRRRERQSSDRYAAAGGHCWAALAPQSPRFYLSASGVRLGAAMAAIALRFAALPAARNFAGF